MQRTLPRHGVDAPDSGIYTRVKTTSLDPFDDRYAKRTHGIRSSAMRDLMAITQRPEVISLAGGLPDTAAFDQELLREILNGIVDDAYAAALQYGPTEGMQLAKDAICHVMAAEGMHVEPGHLIVTTGGQQVLDLFARVFIDPGDVVIAEGPTYPGVVPVFSSYQADVRQIPLDEDGLNPELLEAMLDDLAAEGKRAKYLYTIPTFQNPAGVTTTFERRKRIVEIAQSRDLLVLEDNPYSLLRFEGDPIPTLRSMDTSGRIAYLGTFSKIFAPGVRLGWVEAQPAILAKLNLAKQAADLCSTSLSQFLVGRFFLNYNWTEYLDRLNGIYSARRDAMLRALATVMPDDAHWNTPHGGLFLWATMPEILDTTDLLARALTQNVAFVPGAAAYLDGQGANSMRLNFSAVSSDRIEEGIRRLGLVVEEALGLAHSLGIDKEPEPPTTKSRTAKQSRSTS